MGKLDLFPGRHECVSYRLIRPGQGFEAVTVSEEGIKG